jgi:hypothetical protein
VKRNLKRWPLPCSDATGALAKENCHRVNFDLTRRGRPVEVVSRA